MVVLVDDEEEDDDDDDDDASAVELSRIVMVMFSPQHLADFQSRDVACHEKCKKKQHILPMVPGQVSNLLFKPLTLQPKVCSMYILRSQLIHTKPK